MSIYKKTFSSCLVLMSSLLLISCNQSSSDNQSISTADSGASVVAGKTGPTVALSSSEVSVYEGETYSLDIVMSDFTISEGGGVTLRFDPALLQVVNVTVDGNVWDFKNKDGRINNAEGSVSDILFSSYQGVSGDAKVATVEFKSIAKGSSAITLVESSVNSFAGDGQKIVVAFNATTVVSN